MALVVRVCSQGSPITHLEDCSQVSGNTVTPTHAETQCTHRQRPGERPGMGLAALDGTAAPPMSRVATAVEEASREVIEVGLDPAAGYQVTYQVMILPPILGHAGVRRQP